LGSAEQGDERELRVAPGPAGELAASDCGGRAFKAAYFLMRGRRNAAHAGHDGVLVYIQAGAARIENLHGASYQSQRHRQQPSSSKSTRRAPGCRHPWSQFGVLAGLRVQLLNGLGAPRAGRPRYRYLPTSYAPPISKAPAVGPLHPSESGRPDGRRDSEHEPISRWLEVMRDDQPLPADNLSSCPTTNPNQIPPTRIGRASDSQSP